jgi:hypothetical protein
LHPTPLLAAGSDEVLGPGARRSRRSARTLLLGRLRQSAQGAATNAIQIAERLVERPAVSAGRSRARDGGGAAPLGRGDGPAEPRQLAFGWCLMGVLCGAMVAGRIETGIFCLLLAVPLAVAAGRNGRAAGRSRCSSGSCSAGFSTSISPPGSRSRAGRASSAGPPRAAVSRWARCWGSGCWGPAWRSRVCGRHGRPSARRTRCSARSPRSAGSACRWRRCGS